MSVFKNFIKYQSLGNDFIVFDALKKPNTYVTSELKSPEFGAFVRRLCDRHLGIGADGILIVTHCPDVGMPEMIIYNADGTRAQSCLNGLRCVAHYLFVHHNYPENFSIKLSDQVVVCDIQHEKRAASLVVTHHSPAQFYDQVTVLTDGKQLTGDVVSVGNPHFVITQHTDLEWLTKHGKSIESHAHFPAKTNVEFVWPEAGNQNIWNVLVYERGCGITQACSSGAVAVASLLARDGKVAKNQDLTIKMLGGNVLARVDQGGHVTLKAQAQGVFQGSFDADDPLR
jgi:diaminopimelate epimerase